MNMMAGEEFKKTFLDLLKKDEEFRLAVAGLIGLDAILNELKKLHEKSLEHDKRFEIIEKKLLEHDKRFEAIEKKLLEHDKRFEAIEKKLVEHDKRLEAIEKKLLEHDKRFEAIEKKLLEHDEKFREILEEIRKIWEKIAELNRRLSHVEDNIGALTEAMLSWFTASDLKDLLDRDEFIVSKIRNARVNEEDIDLLIVTNKRVFVVEIKVRPRHKDVGALLAKGDLVSKMYPGKRIELVLAGTRVGGEILEYAESKGIRTLIY